jgi:hypothetical protein
MSVAFSRTEINDRPLREIVVIAETPDSFHSFKETVMPTDIQPEVSAGLPVVYGKQANGAGHSTRLEPRPGSVLFGDSLEDIASDWELAWIDLGGEG